MFLKSSWLVAVVSGFAGLTATLAGAVVYMATYTIDTHAIIRELEAAGMDSR